MEIPCVIFGILFYSFVLYLRKEKNLGTQFACMSLFKQFWEKNISVNEFFNTE